MADPAPRVSAGLRCAGKTAAAGVALLAAATGWAGLPALAEEIGFRDGGLRVSFLAEPAASPVAAAADPTIRPGLPMVARFTVADDTSHAPVGNLAPLAWLVRRDAGVTPLDRAGCEQEIRSLLAGRLAKRADVNFNEYVLLTLDDNNSVSIIDPQIESAKTKTIGVVPLSAKGADFELMPDRATILVSVPTLGRVAVAPLATKRAQYLDVGVEPSAVELQPDGRLAWVGDAKGAAISAIDAASFELKGSVEVGAGPHHIAFRADSRELYVVTPGARTLSVVDTTKLELVATVDLGRAGRAVAFSAHAGRVYVAGVDGKLVAVDARSRSLAPALDIDHPVTAIAVSPDGKRLFALDEYGDRATVLDTSATTPMRTIKTGPGPYRVDFSAAFAYVRHARSAEVLLVELKGLSTEGELRVTPIALGAEAPLASEVTTLAPLLVPLPEGSGVLALSAADRSIYHFVEGMNAPMGSYQTYPWRPLGLLLVDRTLRERAKGTYETEFRAPRAGEYSVVFVSPSSPKIFGCMPMTVAAGASAADAKPQIRLEPLFASASLATGTPQRLEVRLTDSAQGTPIDDLADVMILVMSGPTWQWRGPARGLGDGKYTADVTLPKPGRYMVMVASKTKGIEFGHLPTATAWAGGDIGEHVE